MEAPRHQRYNQRPMKRMCVLCKEPINDPVSEAYYDQNRKEIVWRHKDAYCQKKSDGHYAYMKRWGQTKHD